QAPEVPPISSAFRVIPCIRASDSTNSLAELSTLDLAYGEEKRRRCDDFAVRSPLNLVGFWLLQDRKLSEEQGT
ncbi:MAG: hypothetical protein QG577_502, partial [Thermodesulfobacteriota bacterium]|nr:hypothetical protein [Thermodesulfobacteriota bacterium]